MTREPSQPKPEISRLPMAPFGSRFFSIVVIDVCLSTAAAAPAGAAPTREGQARLPKNTADRRTGVGVALGDPMGFSLKHFFAAKHALQLDVAWLPLHHGAGGIALDYLWHSRVLASNNGIDAIGYVGGGVGFGLWGRTSVAGYDGPHYGGDAADKPVHFGLMLRLPVLGLAFHWTSVPVDVALEGAWSPFVLEVAEPRFGPAHVSVAIKVRYYF